MNVVAFTIELLICCLFDLSGASVTPRVQRAVDSSSHSNGIVVVVSRLIMSILPGACFSLRYSVVSHLKLYFGCM